MPTRLTLITEPERTPEQQAVIDERIQQALTEPMRPLPVAYKVGVLRMAERILKREGLR